jgi:3-oxoacyl-[acyl-carrier-protein] synthase II
MVRHVVRLRRVAITGIGVVSPNGLGREAFARACRDGESGLRRAAWADLDSPDVEEVRDAVVGRLEGFDPSREVAPEEAHRVPRAAALAVAAAREALDDAFCGGGAPEETREAIGVALGTGGGPIEFLERVYLAHFTGTMRKRTPYFVVGGTAGSLASEVSIALGLRGPSHVLSCGCTSAHDAVGHAFDAIRLGRARAMIAGGADAPIVPAVLRAFAAMQVLARRPHPLPSEYARPFSADRDGFVLGEGAWMFVLEDLEAALARGARIHGEIAAYASNCDARHRVRVDPTVDGPVRAIRGAIEQSGHAVDEIGYVNLHGTGTELGDRLETLAMKRALGPRAYQVPMSATKSLVGHPQGACGAAGLAATLLGLREGWLHPTLNLVHPDPECDLDYIPLRARPRRVDVALVNAMGFGAKNAALVVRRDA